MLGKEAVDSLYFGFTSILILFIRKVDERK